MTSLNGGLSYNVSRSLLSSLFSISCSVELSLWMKLNLGLSTSSACCCSNYNRLRRNFLSYFARFTQNLWWVRGQASDTRGRHSSPCRIKARVCFDDDRVIYSCVKRLIDPRWRFDFIDYYDFTLTWYKTNVLCTPWDIRDKAYYDQALETDLIATTWNSIVEFPSFYVTTNRISH